MRNYCRGAQKPVIVHLAILCGAPNCQQAQLLSSLMKASQKLRQQPDCVVTASKSNSNSVFSF
jgi:hypothetical protein